MPYTCLWLSGDWKGRVLGWWIEQAVRIGINRRLGISKIKNGAYPITWPYPHKPFDYSIKGRVIGWWYIW